eukprot:10370237-Alexandrium_andersonii.AAC.1
MLSAVCWGTNYHQVCRINGPKTAVNVSQHFFDLWVKHYGVPYICIVDQGTEFRAEFQDRLCSHGCV